jgi:hypothetical protein
MGHSRRGIGGNSRGVSGLSEDEFVLACGPWLPRLFPNLLGTLIARKPQEVFLFGTPARDLRFSEGTMPVWVDFGSRVFFGIPGSRGRAEVLA